MSDTIKREPIEQCLSSFIDESIDYQTKLDEALKNKEYNKADRYQWMFLVCKWQIEALQRALDNANIK